MRIISGTLPDERYSFIGQVIHGGPTVGKTKLTKQLRFAKSIDSDDLGHEVFPEYGDLRVFERRNGLEIAASKCKDRAVALMINSVLLTPKEVQNKVVLTNIWGRDFMDFLDDAVTYQKGGRIISFHHTPEAMAERSKERDGDRSLPLGLCQKWYDGWIEYGHLSFDLMIELSADEHIADFFTDDQSGLYLNSRIYGVRYWSYREAFIDLKSNAIRFTFSSVINKDDFLVVKRFGEDSDVWTVKYWHGDYGTTISHWNTNTCYEPSAAELEWAFNVISDVSQNL
jgi:hypothetical protein